jgi:hypothetical protein
MVQIPPTHEGFSLSKKEQDDSSIGLQNQTNLLCPTCYLLIAPKGSVVKVAKNVSSYFKPEIRRPLNFSNKRSYFL